MKSFSKKQFRCNFAGMPIDKTYKLVLNVQENRMTLQKGCWLVIMNADQVPPHVGMLFNGFYSSLNIKGIEVDLELATLLRRVDIQKKKVVFVKMNPHPVFSTNFLHEYFNNELGKYEKVTEINTCFAPVRTFMKENYLLKPEEMNYLYEMFPLLYNESMIAFAFSVNLGNEGEYIFKQYKHIDIVEQLGEVRKTVELND